MNMEGIDRESNLVLSRVRVEAKARQPKTQRWE